MNQQIPSVDGVALEACIQKIQHVLLTAKDPAGLKIQFRADPSLIRNALLGLLMTVTGHPVRPDDTVYLRAELMEKS